MNKAFTALLILSGLVAGCGPVSNTIEKDESGGRDSQRGGGAGSGGSSVNSAGGGGKSSGGAGSEIAGDDGEGGGGNDEGAGGNGKAGGGGNDEGAGGNGKAGAGGARLGKGGEQGRGGGRPDGGLLGRGGSRPDAGPGAGGKATDDAGTSPATGGNASGGEFSENTGADCDVSAGATKSNKKLPDPFAMNNGTRISKKAEWECRRNEIKKDIEKYEIGPKQEPPTVEATYSGNKLSVKVTTSAGSITLSSNVSGSGNCVVIGMNGSSSLVSGCVQVPFGHDQVVKYAQDSSQNQSDPFYKVYPDLWKKIGNYSAWSWGISRLIDGIEKVKDQMKVDPTKIAVHGCSYAGKMALFAGAFDERVALTVAQESGGGGITSWRTSQDFTSRTGTNVEKIDNTNYGWFMSSMKSLDPYSLPHDHHELIAMIAPRALIALGNPEYEWLGDESGYKSIMAAKEVWKAMGVEDRIGFDFTGNHAHCQAASSQQSSVKAFVDKFLKGGTANTSIAIKPSSSKFDLDHTKVIDWTTPTLE